MNILTKKRVLLVFATILCIGMQAQSIITVKGKVKKNRLVKSSSRISVKKGCRTTGDGKLTYSKKSGDKGIVVTSDGKLYAKAGTKTGTYKVKITVKAPETMLYKAASKVMNVTVKVRKK